MGTLGYKTLKRLFDILWFQQCIFHDIHDQDVEIQKVLVQKHDSVQMADEEAREK